MYETTRHETGWLITRYEDTAEYRVHYGSYSSPRLANYRDAEAWIAEYYEDQARCVARREAA